MNRTVFLIGIGTLLFFGLGGIWLIDIWHERSFAEIAFRGLSWYWQLLIGLAAGTLSALMAQALINSPFFRKQKAHYYKLIATRIPLNYPVIIFLSLCAGIGEEIFFRAALQPLIGLWLTSFIFVALHGYFSLSTYSISVYGLLMLLIIAGFGYMFRYLGLLSAIIAHSMFDFILFQSIYRARIGGLPDQQDRE